MKRKLTTQFAFGVVAVAIMLTASESGFASGDSWEEALVAEVSLVAAGDHVADLERQFATFLLIDNLYDGYYEA